MLDRHKQLADWQYILQIQTIFVKDQAMVRPHLVKKYNNVQVLTSAHRQRCKHTELSVTKFLLDVRTQQEIQLDLRIGEPMQICIHRKDNSPKPVNHRLALKEGPKVKSDIRRFPAHNILQVGFTLQTSRINNKRVINPSSLAVLI